MGSVRVCRDVRSVSQIAVSRNLPWWARVFQLNVTPRSYLEGGRRSPFRGGADLADFATSGIEIKGLFVSKEKKRKNPPRVMGMAIYFPRSEARLACINIGGERTNPPFYPTSPSTLFPFVTRYSPRYAIFPLLVTRVVASRIVGWRFLSELGTWILFF